VKKPVKRSHFAIPES